MSSFGNDFRSPDIDKVLNEFAHLKTELQTIYTRKIKQYTPGKELQQSLEV